MALPAHGISSRPSVLVARTVPRRVVRQGGAVSRLGRSGSALTLTASQSDLEDLAPERGRAIGPALRGRRFDHRHGVQGCLPGDRGCSPVDQNPGWAARCLIDIGSGRLADGLGPEPFRAREDWGCFGLLRPLRAFFSRYLEDHLHPTRTLDAGPGVNRRRPEHRGLPAGPICRSADPGGWPCDLMRGRRVDLGRVDFGGRPGVSFSLCR